MRDENESETLCSNATKDENDEKRRKGEEQIVERFMETSRRTGMRGKGRKR